MTLSEISAKITSLTGADTTVYTNAQRVVDLNMWKNKIVDVILNSQDEQDYDDPRHGNYPIKTFPLTTNRDYALGVAEKMLKIKDLTVFYDGVNGYRATPVDAGENNLPVGNPTNTTAENLIDSNYAKTAPRYDYKWNGIFLYPRATSTDVANGGYAVIEWFRQGKDFTEADLTTGTEIPGFDDTFHPMLCYGPAFEFSLSRNLPQTKNIYSMLQDYEERLKKTYGSKQLDRRMQMTSIVDSDSYK